MRYQNIHIIRVQIAEKDGESQELSNSVGGWVNQQKNLLETAKEFPKLNIYIPYDPASLLLVKQTTKIKTCIQQKSMHLFYCNITHHSIK